MYRTVETGAWDDPAVRALDPSTKLLFFYLFTNRHTHVSGIYYLPAVLIVEETGLPRRALDTLLHTLSIAHLAQFDAERSVVWVRSMLKHQGKGEKNHRAAAAQLSTLHNSFLIKDFLAEYPEVAPFVSDRVSARVSIGDLPRARGAGAGTGEGTREPSPPPPSRPTGPPAQPALPPALDTAEFRQALADLKQSRKDKRRKPWTPIGEAAQLAALAKLGSAGAVECIRESIRQGWDGLFPGNGKPRATRRDREMEHEEALRLDYERANPNLDTETDPEA